MLDEPGEPVGKDIARNAEFRLELLEMMQPVERGAQNHETPALAHGLERRRQAALAQNFTDFSAHNHPLKRRAYRKKHVMEMPYKFLVATRDLPR
ncbi:hypothetical protein GCM10009087_38930 [Sphingomonas oligophenolica]